MRQRLELNDTFQDIAFKLSEGNPGALTVIVELVKSDPNAFIDLLHLDDMNMRGPQIWVGFKDFAKQDLNVFREAVRSRDEQMIKVVNERCSYDGEVAVRSGASSTR